VGENTGIGEKSGLNVKPIVGVAVVDVVADRRGLVVSVGKICWGVRIVFEG
jgi:hypothetical protein